MYTDVGDALGWPPNRPDISVGRASAYLWRPSQASRVLSPHQARQPRAAGALRAN